MKRMLPLGPLLLSIACVAAPMPVTYAPDPATLYGAKAHRTAFEDPTAAAPAPAATVGPAPRDTATDTSDNDPAKHQRARTGVFWGGIAATAVGGVLLTAFGIGGRVTQSQLAKAYDDADLTYAREDKLADRGKLFNALAGAGAGIAIVGIAMASIAYGLDYSRCGTLAKRRKDCKPR